MMDREELDARLRGYKELGPTTPYEYRVLPGKKSNDDVIAPIGIIYNSTITWRYGALGRDRYQVWHQSSGTHYRGYGSVHARGRHSSEYWLVEILREPHGEGGQGRYRVVERYRAGRDWQRVAPLVIRLCKLLNLAHPREGTGHG